MTKSRNFQGLRSYHVTHRCHNREFLLRAGIDRDEYFRLLWEANRRWDVSVMSYVVTSNHVHLLLSSPSLEDLSGFMAHISGGMSHFYNRRKKRKGSFWEGRYHATLVQDSAHLSRCLFYIALNMVRAKVVRQPSRWRWSSHSELCGERLRYCLLDKERLFRKLAVSTQDDFTEWYVSTLRDMCSRPSRLKREAWWSEASSIVGDKGFVAAHLERRRKNDMFIHDDGLCHA